MPHNMEIAIIYVVEKKEEVLYILKGHVQNEANDEGSG
jgi:hypothetical protein